MKYMVCLAMALLVAVLCAQEGKTLRLETQKIEGKLKKPEVALISLEHRPVFKPMALADINVKKDLLQNIDNQVFENRVYQRPFPVTEKK